MLANPRPLGITINGWLYLLGGFAGILSSFIMLFAFGSASAQLGGMAAVIGMAAFFIGLAFAGLYIWVGNGLLNGKSRARTWALVLGALSLLLAATIQPLFLIPLGIAVALYIPLVIYGEWFDS